MVITLILGLTIVMQGGSVALCGRMYRRYGHRSAWLLIMLTGLVWLFRTGLLLSSHTRPAHQPSPGPTDPAQMLLSLACATLLLLGLGLMDGVHRASIRDEEALRHEKIHLTQLVDHRVTDLEVEIAERKRAEEAVRQDSERFAAIITTQQDVATAELDLHAIMDLVVTRTQRLTNASGAVLQMLDGEELVCRTASGRAAPCIGLRFPRSVGLSGECARSGEILRCNDVESDPRINPHINRLTGARSLIAVPLHYDRQIVGVLLALSTERYAFGGADVHTLQLMAGLIAAAMSHAAEFEVKQALLSEAIERAERDPLTGLLNHRAFHKRLELASERALRDDASLAVAVMDLDNFKFFNDAYGHITGDDVLRRVAAAIQAVCGPEGILARFGGDEFALLVPNVALGEASELAARLTAALAPVGYQPPGYDVAIPMSLSVGVAVFPQEGATRLDVVELADARLRRAKSGASDNTQVECLRASLTNSVEGFSMLNALVTAVDNKDRYTHRHCEDVLVYSLAIARALGLDQRTQDTVAIAALLHDVGKIGVPDHVLRKPGRLTDEEFAAIRQHPVMGAVIVSAVPGFEGTLDAVRHHHERWDGGGYPSGLRGAQIPPLARLMAVADAFSAMTTDRPYRKGMAPEQAMAVLEQGAGTQWDPAFVEAFLHTRRRVPDSAPFTRRDVPQDALRLAA